MSRYQRSRWRKGCLLAYAFLSTGLNVTVRGETAESSTGLDLREAQRIAVLNNANVDVALRNVEAARARIGQMTAPYFPQLAVSMSAEHRANTPQGRSDLRLSGPAESAGDDDRFEVYAPSLTLNWMLFDLQRKYERKQSAAAYEKEEYLLADVKRLLNQSVAQAYYGAMLATENGRTAERDMENNRRMLEDTRLREKAGAAMERDILNFEVRVNDATLSKVDAERSLEVFEAGLAFLLGLGDTTNLVLAFPVPDADIEVPELDLDGLSDQAMAQRPDVQALHAEIAVKQAEMRQEQGVRYPRVEAQAQDGFLRREDMNFSDDDRLTSVGVLLEWDLFTGGERHYAVAAARSVVLSKQAELELLRQDVRRELSATIAVIEAGRQAVEIQSATVQMNDRIHELMQKRYAVGIETLTRANQILNDVVLSERRLSARRVLLFLSLEDLRAAIGASP